MIARGIVPAGAALVAVAASIAGSAAEARLARMGIGHNFAGRMGGGAMHGRALPQHGPAGGMRPGGDSGSVRHFDHGVDPGWNGGGVPPPKPGPGPHPDPSPGPHPGPGPRPPGPPLPPPPPPPPPPAWGWGPYWDDWGDDDFAAGMAFGAVTGAVIGSAAASSDTTVVVPAAATGTVGTVVTVLPAGCVATPIGAVPYERCGTVWYQPQFVGTAVQYLVVAPPPGAP
ncbi:MAG: hypothetical protein QHC65_13025 [Sphingomonas sp.]|nr:hypothetical protein [Sphingomonas sp.]MDX3885341.1 hypothetical protein [Sphingomonas sp.]